MTDSSSCAKRVNESECVTDKRLISHNTKFRITLDNTTRNCAVSFSYELVIDVYRIEMNIVLKKLLKILLISVLVQISEQSMDRKQPCSILNDNENQCSYYCYNIVKPLLQYISTTKAKEQQYEELLVKVHNLEMTNKRMESTILVLKIKLEKQLELEQVYKEKNLNSEELIKEKNKQILELQSHILQNPKSETDLKPLRIITENNASDKSAKMQSEYSINVNLNSAIKENPLIASTDKAQLNANQNNVHLSQITLLETDKPSEIRKPKKSEHYFDHKLSKNCLGKSSDVYMFQVPGIGDFSIPCDSALAGSGWTVIQRRQDGTENFNRNWTDYSSGFGDLRKEFFIGLKKLHLITNSEPHELYIHLEDFESESRYARYNNFVIGNEEEFYAIKSLGEYSGNAENALEGHKDMPFSTPDRNFNNERDCAEEFKSGWWFNQNCYSW